MGDDEIIQGQILEYRKLMSFPRNIIFLDVDGVLNTITTKEEYPDHFTGVGTGRTRLLRQMMIENDAAIVLSSSWKEAWERDKIRNDPENRYLVMKFAEKGVYRTAHEKEKTNLIIAALWLFSDFGLILAKGLQNRD